MLTLLLYTQDLIQCSIAVQFWPYSQETPVALVRTSLEDDLRQSGAIFMNHCVFFRVKIKALAKEDDSTSA